MDIQGLVAFSTVGPRPYLATSITQVKVLSPEICHIALGQGFLHSETSIATHDSGECVGDVPGSEAMVGHSKTHSGTWEGHIVPDIEASNEVKKEVFWCFANRGKVAFRLRLMGLVQKH